MLYYPGSNCQDDSENNGHLEADSSLTLKSLLENRRLDSVKINVSAAVVTLAEEWKFRYFWVLPGSFWAWGSGWHYWNGSRYVYLKKPDRIHHEILRFLVQKIGRPDEKLISKCRSIEKLLRVSLEIEIYPPPKNWKEQRQQAEDQNFLIKLREGQTNG